MVSETNNMESLFDYYVSTILNHFDSNYGEYERNKVKETIATIVADAELNPKFKAECLDFIEKECPLNDLHPKILEIIWKGHK